MGRVLGIPGPEFVGRERELAVLTRALSCSPVVALVEGEAGVGKSRLVYELLARLAADGVRAPVAVCPPYRESLTLGPIVDALRRATDSVGELRLSPLAGALRPVFPEWAGELSPSPEPLEDAAAARHRLFRAFGELLDGLNVGLLVVEDVHWADDVTLEFLLFLAAQQPHGPSLLVTYRPGEVPPGSLLLRLSSRLRAGVTQVRLTLEGLDIDATARLVSSMLEGRPLSTEFATFLHQRTDGIPLAVEEVVRLMQDRADLARRDGEWVRRHLDDIHVPPTIRDAVLERASRLPPDAQAVLRAAAVLADPTDEAALIAVTELPADRARAGLAEALDSRLLLEDDRGEVGFRHLLNCWAIYEAIPAPLRRTLHCRAGRALENRTPRPLMRLARHFREAAETQDWCRYAEQAADLAIVSGDEAAACALLHDLVVHANQPPDTISRLVEKIPYATLTGLDQFGGLVTSLRSALESTALPPAQEGELRFLLGRMLTMMENHEAGREELERAIPLLVHNPRMAARAMLTLGWPRGATTPAAWHLEWLQRAAELTPLMTPAGRLRVIVDQTSALLLLGEEAGWAEAARIPEDSEAIPERWEIARGHVNVTDFAVLWGRYEVAERRLEQGLRYIEHNQYLRPRALLLGTRVHLDYYTGAWAGLADRAEALAGSEHLLPVSRLEPILVIGLLQAANGARAEAEQALRSVLEQVRAYNAVEDTMEPAAALARLYLAEGRVADALTVTEDAIGIVAAKQIWLWATDLGPARAAALVAAGRIDEAAALVAAFEEGIAGRDAPASRAGLATSRAILLDGRDEPAAAEFARAARAWDRLPRPYDALLARERQARCLVAAGRADAGLTLLSEVFTGLADLGARGDAMRVLHMLRRHGVEVRRPWWGGRRGYGDDLSPRELDVARLVIDGRTNRQIAEALFLSPKTVARHLNSAMRKLNVSSRTALAVRLMETGT